MILHVLCKYQRALYYSVCRPSLPLYQLDFGYVIYGSVETRKVTLTNAGFCPVSFNSSHKHLEGTGFSVDIVSKVRALPGIPDEDSLEFSVQFDPAAVHSHLGPLQASLPFNVCYKLLGSWNSMSSLVLFYHQLFNGPVYSIELIATVTKPSLQISRSEIDFERVICGQCKIVTVRISNPFHVRYKLHLFPLTCLIMVYTCTVVVGWQSPTSHLKRFASQYKFTLFTVNLAILTFYRYLSMYQCIFVVQ